MALETGTYISDLVTTNPAAGDAKSQGDDHIRLIKSTLQATFPAGSQAHYPLVSGTVTATTSGTSIDFTSIPSWAKKITFSFYDMSTNGTSLPILQIGDSGGVETGSYAGANVVAQNGLSSQGATGTTGFILVGSVAAGTSVSGVAVITLVDSATNKWVFSVAGATGGTAAAFSGGGAKSLSATLDRIRLTTVNGTDTFDAGTVNILYE